MKINTDGENAHLDDIMAFALVLVNRTWSYQEGHEEATIEKALNEACEGIVIERRDPTDEEIANPRILVLDVGGHYRPELNDFDHHQFPKGTKESAMSLYATSVGLPNGAFDGITEYEPDSEKYPVDSLASFLEEAFPWFRTRVAVDACGPFATAKESGVEWGTIEKFLGPLEDVILKIFENAEPEARVDVVKPLAEMILRKHQAWERVATTVTAERVSPSYVSVTTHASTSQG